MGAQPRAVGIARLNDGARATIRAACPWDAARVQDYIRGLSLSSRYDRFLAPINELSPAELARIGGGNDRQATLIAETKVAGARIVIGEARYAVDGSTCEIALSVADGWRGRGLGMLLMEYLECRARSLGLTRLVGDVLRSNTAMRTLARKAGFDQSGVPMDARLVGIVKDISVARVATPCGRSMAAGLSLAA
ncbi:MAG TPA: GNAT family N-acetyltransferase [Xanthobacteraceae bacterium]|nr:GNAT family N-acetyltransferase [Xanthobacteraceae bacterium]